MLRHGSLKPAGGGGEGMFAHVHMRCLDTDGGNQLTISLPNPFQKALLETNSRPLQGPRKLELLCPWAGSRRPKQGKGSWPAGQRPEFPAGCTEQLPSLAGLQCVQ